MKPRIDIFTASRVDYVLILLPIITRGSEAVAG